MTVDSGDADRVTFPKRELIAVALLACFGLVTRVVLVLWSPGTLDVDTWEGHVREIERLGLVPYYRGGLHIFNHPPLSGWAIYGLNLISEAGGPAFPVLLRAPLVVVDAATGWGVVVLAGLSSRKALRDHRHLLGALYWASPLAIVLSAQHGNTDPVVACSLVWALVAFARGRPEWAGIALGLGAWIKTPGLLAVPAIFLVLPGARSRIRFAAALGVTTLVGYLPALMIDPAAVIEGVFGYSGLWIRTPSGASIFGPQVFYPDPESLSPATRATFEWLRDGYYRADGKIVTGLVVVYAVLRRRHRTPDALAATLAQSYALLYAFTNAFAWQYLAWALPLWLFASWPLAIVAHVLCTAYVWGLYIWLCEHWFLLDTWRFLIKPIWPDWVLLLRDACVAYLVLLGVSRLVQAGREEWRSWRGDRDAGARAEA